MLRLSCADQSEINNQGCPFYPPLCPALRQEEAAATPPASAASLTISDQIIERNRARADAELEAAEIVAMRAEAAFVEAVAHSEAERQALLQAEYNRQARPPNLFFRRACFTRDERSMSAGGMRRVTMMCWGLRLVWSHGTSSRPVSLREQVQSDLETIAAQRKRKEDLPTALSYTFAPSTRLQEVPDSGEADEAVAEAGQPTSGGSSDGRNQAASAPIAASAAVRHASSSTTPPAQTVSDSVHIEEPQQPPQRKWKRRKNRDAAKKKGASGVAI